MNRRSKQLVFAVLLVLIISSLACQLAGYNISKNDPETTGNQITVEVVQIPSSSMPEDTPIPPSPTMEPSPTPEPPTPEPPTATVEPPTATATIAHLVMPTDNPALGVKVFDVVSYDTAPEKRAPYGDSYQINRLERPFAQDMTYLQDLDIASYHFSQDKTWTYVSIQMVGSDPNNELGIQFGVELDIDADGFGDYVILAKPPFAPGWSTTNVQIFQDKNHDTGGKSAEKSDAPVVTDGYETLVFDGAAGVGSDVDLAWVRVNAGVEATVQFAFKKEFPKKWFMLGVFADTGLKDPAKLDYVDRFTIEEAGSPVKDNKNYPLKELFYIDNVCREALGFEPTGYEPQLCPRNEPTQPQPGTTETPGWNFLFPYIPFCVRPSYCHGQGFVWDADACRCNQVVY